MTEALVAQAVSVERSGRRLLTDFDLSAAAGSVTALVGPNGAGKTTALKALAGLLPYRGSVRIHGQESSTLSWRERARLRAYVPQQSLLQSGIVVRQVVSQGRYAHAAGLGVSRAPDHEAVQRAMASTHVSELAERAWHELSGGEQRRVLLARALATAARLVLLDEPTAGLDVAHALRFLELLRAQAAAGMTIVVVLHDLDQARRYAQRVLLLQRGRVVAQGAAHDVIASNHLRDVYGVELVENAALGFRLLERGP
jgi:iron complex transport system ATP-binding protein